jgi:hypothetical protein
MEVSNMIDTPQTTTRYLEATRALFGQLTKLYGSNGNLPCDDRVAFWKLGNTFDTMIDYLDVIDPSSAPSIAQMVVVQLNASLNCIKGGFDGAWFDDFGWWSVAAQRALQKSFFKNNPQPFQHILDECWMRFTNNAPFVWQRHKVGFYDNYGPAVEGGVWNAYWLHTSDTFPGPKNGNPADGGLIGIQNTVTNALYFMAAHRLGHTDPIAKKAAEREFNFLLTWFDATQSPLWRTITTDAGLVRERVGHLAQSLPAPGFQLDWAWAGDQGLILGGLSDAMLHLDPVSRGPLLKRAEDLLRGVSLRLAKNNNNVVRSYTEEGHIPSGDFANYQTGSGVFWRNALYVWKTNPDLQRFLTQPEYQAIIRASADAALFTPIAGASFEELTNQVATLVAATAMLAQ